MKRQILCILLFIFIIFTGCGERILPQTSFAVHFEMNDADQQIHSLFDIKVGDIIDDIPEITRDGFTFLGWYNDFPGNSTKVTFPFTIPPNFIHRNTFWAVFIPINAIIYNGFILNKIRNTDDDYYEIIGLYPRGDVSNLVLPNEYNGIPVRVIKSNGEYELSLLVDFWYAKIRSLEIPENIIKVPNYSFWRGNKPQQLRKVFLANPNTIIEPYAFDPFNNVVKIFFDYDEFLAYN